MNKYQEQLKKKMGEYVHFVYRVTRSFPKEELYGSVSQWRRATLSIVLNYIVSSVFDLSLRIIRTEVQE